ncbi:MAG: hypothetical protein ACSHX6_12390 [Akkermansiaceae bacterium]
MVQATPSEYFDRVTLQNSYFGDDTEIIGFNNATDIVHIATRQSYIHGSPPSAREIETFMIEAGFKLNRAQQWENDEVLIADAHTGNFIKTSNGGLVPINLIVVLKKSIGL